MTEKTDITEAQFCRATHFYSMETVEQSWKDGKEETTSAHKSKCLFGLFGHLWSVITEKTAQFTHFCSNYD